MVLALVAAMDCNRAIGRAGVLPWRLPADLKHFRGLTLGKPVIMGRTTFESIGHPLHGRTNIVITRNPDYRAEGCVVMDSLEAALERFADAPELMVIGGASVYAQAMPRATRIYLTRIHHAFTGDRFFPEYPETEWIEVAREDHRADEKNPYDYSFVTLEKKAA